MVSTNIERGLKIGINNEWTDAAGIHNQICAARILQDIGIPQPAILAYADNKAEYGFRFLLFEAQMGVKLYDLYQSSNPEDRIKLFESLAHTYSKIHHKKNSWSGVWNGSPDKSKYPIHPARFYSVAEINGGSGHSLYREGMISRHIFDAICDAWDSNLPFLEHRESSLVHISPFPWSIYLSHKSSIFSPAKVFCSSEKKSCTSSRRPYGAPGWTSLKRSASARSFSA